MLVTFNSKETKQKQQQQQQQQQNNHSDSNAINGQSRSFMATTSRRKKASSGCITCKIRKKRCSEEKPVCSDCKRLGKHCVWVTDGMDSKEVKEIRKKVREEEERNKTLKGLTRKKSESPKDSQRKDANELQDDDDEQIEDVNEDFTSLDTENYNPNLESYPINSTDNSSNRANTNEITEITDFSFSPFINSHDFNDTGIPKSPSQLMFQPFKSNYLNSLFQPLSPNTLTLLGSHETLSSLNNANNNGSSSNSNLLQFNNLFESNIRTGHDKTVASLDDEFKDLEIPSYLNMPEFQLADYYAHKIPPPPPPLPPQTSLFPPGVSLDATGLKLYDYYKNHLSSIVSIVPSESNYYKKIFLPMAAINQGTLYAILAWSGYHMGGDNVKVGDKYMELALDFLQSPTSSPTENGTVVKADDENKSTTLQKLASLLIMCAAEICKGDVKKWPVLLRWCSSIIARRGGLKTFGGGDKSSKWIISNFIYHDILASSVNERSTHFPIEEYNAFLKMNNFFDPLQGILKPVFNLMGEVSKMSFNKVNELDQIMDLQKRIEESEPEEADLKNFNNEQKIIQMRLFRTFKLTCILYLRQSLLRINSSSLETQVLLTQLLDNLSIVLNSSVESSLCFPMFITGINCVNENHRVIIMVHFDSLIKRYNFKNLERIKFLVKRIWELNENGERFVDWFKIVKDLNWDVSFA